MFKSGDKIIAVRDITTKYHGIDHIKEGTEGIVVWYDSRRDEMKIQFVGHLESYGIRGEDVKHYI